MGKSFCLYFRESWVPWEDPREAHFGYTRQHAVRHACNAPKNVNKTGDVHASRVTCSIHSAYLHACMQASQYAHRMHTLARVACTLHAWVHGACCTHVALCMVRVAGCSIPARQFRPAELVERCCQWKALRPWMRAFCPHELAEAVLEGVEAAHAQPLMSACARARDARDAHAH